MKQFLKIIMVTLTMMSLFSACSKTDPLPHHENGNAVQLSSSATTLTPTVADSNSVVVTFSWTNPNYATDTSNYKFVLEIDSAGGDFLHATKKVVLGQNGTTLTGRELNTILITYGFTVGAPTDVDVRVKSSYANNNELYYSNIIKLSVTPFNDPSQLTSTVSDVVLTLGTAGNTAGTFNWTPSFPGYTGPITYSIEYDLAGAGFAAPGTIVIVPDSLVKTFTEDLMNQTAVNSGVVPGAVGTIEYRIKAVTALGAISYSNVVNVQIQTYISILRFYMPGGYQTSTGNGTDWTPSNAPQLIREQRTGLLNNMYYIYIYLPAAAEFKFTQGPDWPINYGTGAGPNTLALNGGNLSVPTAGFYRIAINVSTLEYNIMEGRMGFVGGATGAGWSPPDVFPNYALGNSGTNLFVGLTDLVTGSGWKMIDNNIWNAGNTVFDSRSYGTPLASGSTLEINGADFAAVPSDGRYRAIWDGRDVDNVKYELSPATEMRIVGDGLGAVPQWDPGGSPQMTYSGNGVWTITLPLDADESFKFVAGNAWGAFDYEDNSGQSNATGVAKKIQWASGPDFKTPATAGTYTVILDEHNQTVTVN